MAFVSSKGEAAICRFPMIEFESSRSLLKRSSRGDSRCGAMEVSITAAVLARLKEGEHPVSMSATPPIEVRPVSLFPHGPRDFLSGVRPALILDPVSVPAPESGLGTGSRGGRRDGLSLENEGVV